MGFELCVLVNTFFFPPKHGNIDGECLPILPYHYYSHVPEVGSIPVDDIENDILRAAAEGTGAMFFEILSPAVAIVPRDQQLLPSPPLIASLLRRHFPRLKPSRLRPRLHTTKYTWNCFRRFHVTFSTFYFNFPNSGIDRSASRRQWMLRAEAKFR